MTSWFMDARSTLSWRSDNHRHTSLQQSWRIMTLTWLLIFRTKNLKFLFLILRIQNCYCIIHAKSVQTSRANRSMSPVTSRRVNFLSAIPNLENQNHFMKSGAWQHHLLTSTWTFTLGPLRGGFGDGPGVMFCTFKTMTHKDWNCMDVRLSK